MSAVSRVRFAACASALALSTVACAAQAQTSGAGAGEAAETNDIVVIGRGRNEALQSAPIAVTAFSEKALEDARIQGASDFISLTPNVSIVQSQSAGTSFITIRGISQVRNGESPVAVVVDGVQQVSSRQFTRDLSDVQQIEVLRGPQGALYGRNAIGGAIIITTKQPTNDFEGSVSASAASGNDYRVTGSLSGPIVADALLFRVAGSYRDFGGQFDNVYLDKKVDFARETSLRGQLRALISPEFTADLRVGYNRVRAGAANFQYQSAKEDAAQPCFLDPANPFGGPAPDADRVTRDFCANNLGYGKRELFDASLRLEYDAGFATFSNVLAYIKVREDVRGDQFPYTASRNIFGTDGTQTQFENMSAWSNEFRIASPSHGRFRWMVGAYYLHTKRFISTTTGQDNGLGIIPIHRAPAYADPVNPTLTFLADDNRNVSYAFFGNVSYDLTDTVEASFGYRYDHDRRRQTVDPLSSAGLPTGCTAATLNACERATNFSKSQPKITINWKPSRSLTLFADYGIGFRSGQYNQAGAAAAANLPGVFDLARPETANTAEAGFKSTLLDGRLRINGTAFHTIDKNSFYFLFVGAVGAQILVNIDKAELVGGEIEASFTPVDGLELFGNYGYTYSKIKRFTYNPALVGNKAPYIPVDSGVIGAQYRTALTESIGIFARAELEHHGKQYWEPENSTARSAFQLLNLQLGVEHPDRNWSVTAFVNNLTDKRYNAEFVSGGFVQPAQPRSIGIELKASF